ncbi:hypothetical protein U8Q07_15035 [Rhizobium ruizarguesonis]|nr:hypothetical protein U8Q07_15035 [Rhizobium ruizarguesonis]
MAAIHRRKLLAICALLLTSRSAFADERISLLGPEVPDLVTGTSDQACSLSQALRNLAYNKDYKYILVDAAKKCRTASDILDQAIANPVKLTKAVGLRKTLNKRLNVPLEKSLQTTADIAKIMKPIVDENQRLFDALGDSKGTISEEDYEKLLTNLADLTLINSALLGFPTA